MWPYFFGADPSFGDFFLLQHIPGGAPRVPGPPKSQEARPCPRRRVGAVERNIKGPYFFGADPSFVDFFLLQHMDGRMDMFEKLQVKTGRDLLVQCPKIKAVIAGLRSLDSYKASTYKVGTFKQAIIDAY